jgi:hypothetical protein
MEPPEIDIVRIRNARADFRSVDGIGLEGVGERVIRKSAVVMPPQR